MLARQALRDTVHPALAGQRIARRPGGHAALASAIGNRAFCQLIARDDRTKAPAKKTPKLNYALAEKQNKSFGQQPSETASWGLGWESKLATVAPDLDALWKAGSFDAFADAVAALQVKQGAKGKGVDGVLGPGTWSKLAGLGEGMASLPVVQNTDGLCYMATQRRIEGGTARATGKTFKLPKGASKKHFDTIIATHAGKMMDIEEQYRATGAAGALVYSGQGTFVSEADIWAGKLVTGAAMQVWYDKSAYDLLKKGEFTETDGKTRPIKKGDANFLGTSYTFLRYDDSSNEKMLVRHHSGVEWVSKSEWAVWIAANPGAPAVTPAPATP